MTHHVRDRIHLSQRASPRLDGGFRITAQQVSSQASAVASCSSRCRPAQTRAPSLEGLASATDANTSDAATFENATLNCRTMVNPRGRRRRRTVVLRPPSPRGIEVREDQGLSPKCCLTAVLAVHSERDSSRAWATNARSSSSSSAARSVCLATIASNRERSCRTPIPNWGKTSSSCRGPYGAHSTTYSTTVRSNQSITTASDPDITHALN
ncbi:MAG: hypothetical protein JWR48_6108 [Mycobacterium sp.]|jgi:hypothetical protein|nr:hypothetical protein [Mycobacterium sp.]